MKTNANYNLIIADKFLVYYSCKKKDKRVKRDCRRIVVSIKLKLSENITLIQYENVHITSMWFKIKNLGDLDDVYMCCTYISPRSSCRYMGDFVIKLELLKKDILKITAMFT